MNLPIFHQLPDDQSTYLTFTKSLNDLDYAISNDTEYYFSDVVALNLPIYQKPNFFINLQEVDIQSENPNLTFPKTIQFYMENIIRQDEATQPEITEIAFWKTLNKMGLSYPEIQNTVKFSNKIVTSNFTKYENNVGWSEVIAVIPNKCDNFTPSWKLIDMPDVFAGDMTDKCMWDTGTKTFNFSNKQVLDFNNFVYNKTEESSFEFNVLLFYYIDKDGVRKLHGINFINNFDNKLTYYELPKLKQRTNDARSIGYQFSVNLKTVNNEASLILVEEYNKQAFGWNNYFEILSSMNNFLLKAEMKEDLFQ